MILEPTTSPSKKDGLNIEKEPSLNVDSTIEVTHHSNDEDEEYDDRKFPEAEIA